MTVAPYTTSFPVTAAAREFGVPQQVADNFAYGIILNARGEEQNGWTKASADIVQKLIGFSRMVEMHDKLLATAIAQGVIPAQELPR